MQNRIIHYTTKIRRKLSGRLAPRGETQLVDIYIKNNRRPWSEGYVQYRDRFIGQTINDRDLMTRFAQGQALPDGYGEFLDERVVEYPWILTRLGSPGGRLFDAGSALNFDYLLQHGKMANRDITIATLEPEGNCYWYHRISYIFSDLRDLPIKDDWFEETVSISTIEHIGMDNTIYSSNPEFKESNCLDFLTAVTELKRVTKPGGRVFITVPYGKYTNFGWYQQFDSELIDRVIDTFKPDKQMETYFCYERGGWSISDKEYCRNFGGFNIHDTKYFKPGSTKDYDPDFAACSRAIAALELWK